MPSSITPTVGRKVWYWGTNLNACKDMTVPFDATVIFVPDAKTVQLKIVDHFGNLQDDTVELRDPSTDENKPDMHGAVAYATWMPYQVGRAAAAKAAEIPAGSETTAA